MLYNVHLKLKGQVTLQFLIYTLDFLIFFIFQFHLLRNTYNDLHISKIKLIIVNTETKISSFSLIEYFSCLFVLLFFRDNCLEDFYVLFLHN